MDRKHGYITRQAKRLRAGEINRRRFVMQALSAGVTMPTAMSLASRAEAQPRKGGLFRIATRHGSTGDTLDPVSSTNGFTRFLHVTRGNALTEISWDGRVIGALAENFETDDDGKNWVFTLRQGVEFHNGKPLTADDVLFSLNRHRQGLLRNIADIRNVGSRQIVINLMAPQRDIDRLCADERLTIHPAADGRSKPIDAYVGTGPYSLSRFDAGARATFNRNPNYWKPNAAHFDAVELTRAPDDAARLHAVMNGEVDYADGIAPKAMAAIRQMPTLDTYETQGTKSIALSLHAAGTSTQSPHLRLAIQHTIRRRELVDKVLLGHGVVSADMSPDAEHPDPIIEFDAARAADHYARSGHAGPIPLIVKSTAYADAKDVARLIAASAAEAGITLIPTTTENALQGEETALHMPAIGPGEGDIIPVRANEIAAHSKSLMHDAKTATHTENDGFRIAERWWFS